MYYFKSYLKNFLFIQTDLEVKRDGQDMERRVVVLDGVEGQGVTDMVENREVLKGLVEGQSTLEVTDMVESQVVLEGQVTLEGNPVSVDRTTRIWKI